MATRSRIREKCPTCGQVSHYAIGPKEERIEYYLDSAFRLGAAIGDWQHGQDRAVTHAACDGGDAMKTALLSMIMNIVNEPVEEPQDDD